MDKEASAATGSQPAAVHHERVCVKAAVPGGALCGDTRSAVSEVSVVDLSNIVHCCRVYPVCTMQWLSVHCPLLTLVSRAFR